MNVLDYELGSTKVKRMSLMGFEPITNMDVPTCTAPDNSEVCNHLPTLELCKLEAENVLIYIP